MANPEPGRIYAQRTPDPDQPCYRLSEANEHDLRVLAEALRSASSLCDGYDDAEADFSAGEAAPLFRVFGEYAARLLAEARFHSP